MTSDSRKGIIASVGKTGSFLITFGLVFAGMFLFLAAVDTLPNGPVRSASQPVAHEAAPSHSVETTSAMIAEAPVRVVAPAIGMNVTVSNPSSTNVDVLDTALLKGAVRYPTSAMLGVNGTVLLFGHSSYLPIVHNQNYKAFDGIQNLKKGETISVYSGANEYRYAVSEVRVADATEDVVELSATGKHLILVTCDSFTKKTNRFVVTADLVGTYSLAK
jgi:LPXTG-site transpeptidase (sortase) family protein